MKKILFIDRDGTLIEEPKTDFQVDTFEKFIFLPHTITYLSKIVTELDYELVMVTNQDGLGTPSFPENTFWPVQLKMIQILENEGIRFKEILIDNSFEDNPSPNRKPSLGMLQAYIHGQYDLANSFVIGDRKTDVQLAKNLNCQSIYLNSDTVTNATFNAQSWIDIYNFLKQGSRKASVNRKTKETDIQVVVDLNGLLPTAIQTGLGFYDHMLDQIAKHAQISLQIQTKGDLHIDEHHTVEDTAIVLGTAFLEALGSKKGIERYGFCLPMDDCLAQVALDFGGRPWIEWDVKFEREKIGDVPTELFFHFFKSFSDASKCNLNIKASGYNEHHKIEAIFKAFAKAIKMAITQNNDFSIPSTKGIL